MAKIFVFGSNLLGIHKKGAALTALEKHGAKLGQGIGLQGNSYAIPTKENPRRSLDLCSINKFVADFILYASYTPEHCYMVTPIGCGLAGWRPEHIAPMFHRVFDLKNVKLPKEFVPFLSWMETFPDSIATFSDY
jgi:hypothetical protein